MLLTSLNEIKSFSPCASGWKDILRGQKKTEADGFLFPLVDCLDSCSISDVCWLLGKRGIEKKILVSFARACADSVKHLQNYAAHDADDAAAAAAAHAAYAAAHADACSCCAAVAAHVAASAADATYVAAHDADDARQKQMDKNKEFLRLAIVNYSES